MYRGLVAIFFHVSIDRCFSAIFVAKSTVQRFMCVFVPFTENLADLLTKTLSMSKLLTLKILLGLERMHGHVVSSDE
jgi:hypothetical protein